MRVSVIALNSLVALFFIGFLTYTFVARQHLDGLARRFVTEKTVKYSAPVVDLAEKSLEEPLVRRLLPAAQKVAIHREIDQYRRDPAAYITDLTRQAGKALQLVVRNPLLAKVAAIKEQIRAFYDDTLNALVEDLRIFSTCNLISSLMALGLAYWSRGKIKQSLVWFSFLMFVTVIYCAAMYVDDLTFFGILFRSHMGWWYAVLLCLVLFELYRQCGHMFSEKELSPAEQLGDEKSGRI